MTKEVTKISVRAYADSLKISDKTVRNAIKDGNLKKGISYKVQIQKGQEVHVPEIIKEIADEEWGFLHKTDKRKPGQKKDKVTENSGSKEADKKQKTGAEISDDADYEDETELISKMKINRGMRFNEAVRIRELIAAAEDKIKLQELEKQLVRKSEVEKNLFLMADEIKKELLNIPNRIIDMLMVSTNKAEGINILTSEIETVLTKLTNGRY